jgi:hypothetical protein
MMNSQGQAVVTWIQQPRLLPDGSNEADGALQYVSYCQESP